MNTWKNFSCFIYSIFWLNISIHRSLKKSQELCFMEKEMATHSIILAWDIPHMEEPGGLQSISCKDSDMADQLMLLQCLRSIMNIIPELLEWVTGGAGIFLSQGSRGLLVLSDIHSSVCFEAFSCASVCFSFMCHLSRSLSMNCGLWKYNACFPP